MEPENEITTEFARDSQEILGQIRRQCEAVAERLHRGEVPEPGAINSMARDFEAIKDSAEFLDLGPIFRVAADRQLILERLVDSETMFTADHLEAVAASCDFLDDQADHLIEHGSVDLERPLPVTCEDDAVAPTLPEPVAAELGSVPTLDDFRLELTPEMMEAFVVEAEEYLRTTEASLLGLEKDLGNSELLDSAFRAMHTFKGNSGLFNYADLEKLGHVFESILETYKNGEKPVEHAGITLMLGVLDTLQKTVDGLPESEGRVPDRDRLIQELSAYQRDRGGAAADGSVSVATDDPEPEAPDPRDARSTMAKQAASQNIRVDLHKLDALMNLVGELIVAENAVAHNPELDGLEIPMFRKASVQLERITRELQDIAMSLRMIPIAGTFQKMVRVVRDVSRKQGKQVDLVTEGEDTEIDKSVVESLANPLLHIIRNAIDHGIETAVEREACGKPVTGTVVLRAFHEGGEVVIEVRDDGRGIQREKILAKAIEVGLIEPGGEPESDAEIFALLFEPGFSTASVVTDISGRGVGMDVVKSNIEAVSGRVHVTSKPGEGTCFTIRIPLTLAIIEGMMVRVGRQLFTVPLLSIRESLRVTARAITRTIDRSELIDIRGELVPVIRLHRLFDLAHDHADLTAGILVVVEQDRRRYCLFVDEVVGRYQTVIKGLNAFLGSVRGISGTSILSNGDISLILDIQRLIDHHTHQDPQERAVTVNEEER